MGPIYNFLKTLSSQSNDCQHDENSILINEVQRTMRQLKDAEMYFQNVTDPDLIDQAIYNLESLRKKYRYLIKKAKENGISLDKINTIIS